MLKPYVEQKGVFASGDLRKSFHSGSLNKVRELSGGRSGYRSESRHPVTQANKFTVVGCISPANVTKTIIYTGGKRLSKPCYVKEAYKIPYVTKVEYISEKGKMVITNTNIK